ncbi:MAG: heme o synthase [Elusimicrobia bacterium]|nr:heme o synthase [Elusimicrobiota bacterium]
MKAYLELSKPRIAVLVMATAAAGYFLAGGHGHLLAFWGLIAGVGLAAAGAGAGNQCLESGQDALMKRTSRRPLPSGRIESSRAAAAAAVLSLSGLAVVALSAGLVPFLLTALTLLVYLGAYTPLKRVTPHSTWLGAAAGAAPPLIGWAAASGGALPFRAWVLFMIQFLWQIPHFLSLFWMYREDYRNAGFKVVTVVDPDGGLTAFQIAMHTFTVLLASLLPVFCGMAGIGYGIGALILSALYLALGMRASWTLAADDTRRLFLASLAYLPLLFGMLWLGGA